MDCLPSLHIIYKTLPNALNGYPKKLIITLIKDAFYRLINLIFNIAQSKAFC